MARSGKQSAGLLVYRMVAGETHVFLVHPGGPFWAKKDDGAWSIPKGEFTAEENPLLAARREFHEETGVEMPGPAVALDPVKQAGGKTVHAWMVKGDVDATTIVSNRFSMEWPPRSGAFQDFPEVDRANWFAVPDARVKILKGQRNLLDQLEHKLGIIGTNVT